MVTAIEPTPIQLAAPKENEYEVWAREDSVPPSLLVVMVVGGKNPMKIIDPPPGTRKSTPATTISKSFHTCARKNTYLSKGE